MDDLLIRGGEVIDGSGAPGRIADVTVTDGRIVAIDAARPGRPAVSSMPPDRWSRPALSTFTPTPTSPCR